MAKRLLLVTTTTGYQTRAFVEAAQKLALEVTIGSDRCHVLDDPWQDGALALHLEDPEGSAHVIAEAARRTPFDAIVSLGDRPTVTAAHAARALEIPFHPPQTAEICRDKYLSRARLKVGGLLVPDFLSVSLDSDPNELARTVAGQLGFPCVLKPRMLSGSRGVIRADNMAGFTAAFERLRALLESPEVRVMRDEASDSIQVESYIEGTEIAAEALVDHGQLRVLAIFDKPDLLEGPFFEETIYVTPSRLTADRQAAVVATLDAAVRALGLYHGPVHAEFRLNAEGVWPLEVAARAIGGLCSRALRCVADASAEGADRGGWMSLEELLIRLALEEDVERARRETDARGVMMIPVPEAGILEGVEGAEEARRIPGVDEVRITAKPEQKLVPLPEGCSYPGFIFASGPTPEFVEQALRLAHRELRFVVARALPVV